MQVEQAGEFILNKIEKELPETFYYHNIDHTRDVYAAAKMIGEAENITDDEMQLLLTAACYHDSGYLVSIHEHEKESCKIAREHLPSFWFSQPDIDKICGMIMATRIPQSPRNHLEQILADADLDYLGRDDFFTIGDKFYRELGLTDRDEWNRMQVKFLNGHQYFTQTALNLRGPKRRRNLEQVKALLHKRPMKRFSLPHAVLDTIYVVLGILFCGFALKSFLVPNNFFDGGVTGISLLISETYHIPIAYVIVVVNIPFIVMGARQVNRAFALKTLAAVIGLGLCLLYMPEQHVTSDHLLICIFGGVFMGIGVGLSIRGGCALDGIEVLALYTGKRISFTISEIILGINIIIFLIAGIQLGLPTALYSILTYYAASRTSHFVIEGLEEYTGVTIISAKSEIIKERLVMELGRGITVYKGERGFLKQSFDVSHPVDIIFTVVTRLEVRRLKNMVHDVDHKAFIFTSTIKEAAGGVLKRRARDH
ncbi:MAG: YitT family protein [Bacteroidetes bacterium]|nr:YitT family protein [Bacteroidota bacterium]